MDLGEIKQASPVPEMSREEELQKWWEVAVDNIRSLGYMGDIDTSNFEKYFDSGVHPHDLPGILFND